MGFEFVSVAVLVFEVRPGEHALGSSALGNLVPHPCRHPIGSVNPSPAPNHVQPLVPPYDFPIFRCGRTSDFPTVPGLVSGRKDEDIPSDFCVFRRPPTNHRSLSGFHLGGHRGRVTISLVTYPGIRHHVSKCRGL
ncbi:hypothetical protein BDM02DRAFT_3114287 [Thelephora ganbajun]|uniref:Uncharacterized protein n=1 Tax=Thelephora ganbajun TaxID=370292 RepID=A0ACB6ZHY1_THEGA|nr:hypothetical protein BDM02DRAFT_3114287 [Thelephora ganbajun]